MIDDSFAWNRSKQTSEFWDPSANGGRGLPTYITNSLKYQLENPNGIKSEDAIRNISIGLAMIMDEIEELKRNK